MSTEIIPNRRFFFSQQEPTPKPEGNLDRSDQGSDQRWRIGHGGINRANIRVIGAVHVSTGSWMPILQLNFFVI